MRMLIVGIALVAASVACQAEDAYYPSPGFFTGNDYEAQSPAGRLAYLTGIMDGFLFAPMWSKNGYLDHSATDKLDKCNHAVGMTNLQFVKVVDSYMEKHVSSWGAPMNGTAFLALTEFCRGVGQHL